MLLANKNAVFKNEGALKIWHVTSGVGNHSASTGTGSRELTEALSAVSELVDITDLHFFIASLAAQYGFQCTSTFTFIPAHPQSHAVYMSGSGWSLVRYYRENACFKNDASLRHIKSQRTPFSWDPAYYRKSLEYSLSPAERAVISTVLDHGVTQVAFMPFHGATGDRGAFRFLRIGAKPLNDRQIKRFFHQTFYLFHLLYEQQLKLLKKDLDVDQAHLLSSKEVCVLNLYAAGDNPPKIADQLGISPHTVQQHLRNIRNKLGVRNAVHAIKKASTYGLLSE